MTGGFYWLSQPGRPLQTAGPGCAGCHIRTTLEWDGPAAAAFSKGVHALNPNRVFPGSIPQSATAHQEPSAQFASFKADSFRAAECLSCHASAHEAWEYSAHGRAFTNPIFQHAFERDRKAWCLNCHAPLWDARRDGEAASIAEEPDIGALYAEGINCVSCHVRDGEIHAATDYSKKPDVKLFHPVRYDPGLARDSFCAGCHQFNFVHELEPFTVYEGDEHPMQNVVRESRESNGALYPAGCTGCHYAQGDHSLKSKGARRLRDKMVIEIATTRPGAARPAKDGPDGEDGQRANRQYSVTLKLSIPRIAHHFPTGDLFRILSFYIYDAQGGELYRYDFRKEVRVVDRAVISDTTLKPRPDEYGAHATIQARLARRPARCSVVYRLQGAIDPDIAGDFKDPAILSETVYEGSCGD
ncbi:MAG: cytochrome c family protein [bacterium]|nr:cytochrome c family protein [bacterium]